MEYMTEREALEVINNYKLDCTMPGTFRMIKALSVVTSGMETLQRYRKIGTVEECQEARELQVAVEPRQVILASGRKGYECPNCGNEPRINAFYGTYCHWCGKKLDWDKMGIKESLW